MSAREELTAMFAPFFSGTTLTEAADEAYAVVLNAAADAIDASSETCKCDDCEVSRLNAAKLRHMAASPAAAPVPDETAESAPVASEWAVRWPDGSLTPASRREHAVRAVESARRVEPGAVLIQRTCTPWTEVAS